MDPELCLLMETVMQKNIVVHNENRNLEDSMAEMEKELVDVKMQWATVSSSLPIGVMLSTANQPFRSTKSTKHSSKNGTTSHR